MDELIARYSKLPAKQRLAGFSGILIAVLAGYWYLVYSGQSAELDVLKAQYIKLDSERRDKEEYINNLAKYEARYNELQLDLNKARSELPDDPDVPNLLAQLGNKARQAGLAIDRFEPKGESIQQFYADIIFDMKVKGSYHEVATFVDSLGKLDRIINVTGLSMAAPRTVNQKVLLDGSFTIKTYRFVDAAEAASAQAAAGDKKKGKSK
jgi:type IV pilus assembly protein PilO